MLELFLASSIVIFISFQIGRLIACLFKIDSLDYTQICLLGIISLNSTLGIISFIYPVGNKLLIAISLISVLISILVKNKISLRIEFTFESLFFLTFISLLGLLKASNYIENYDSGLYHIQIIKWSESYSIVPGLANLHGRFGFNSNVFLLDSLFLFTGFNDGVPLYPINISLFVIISFYFISKIFDLIKSSASAGLILFCLAMLIVIFRLDNFSSPSPDFFVNILIIYLLSRMVIDYSVAINFPDFLSSVLICFYLITIKLSSVPILFIILILYLKNLNFFTWKQYVILFGVILFILVPWLTRNVIISGWLVYPFAGVDIFDFDWKVPKDLVISESNSIVGWARRPGSDYLQSLNVRLIDWSSVWWQNQALSIKFILGSCFVFSIINVVLMISKREKLNNIDYSFICTLLGVLFWFFTAPDFRFGYPFIIFNFWFLLLKVNFRLNINYCKYVVIFLMFVFPLYSARREIIQFYSTRAINFIKPLGFKNDSSKEFETHKIEDGYILVPRNNDQCFDCKLPCTPYYDNNLSFRINNNLQSGFRRE